MRKNVLGKTNIEVTELCFGALPMGPLQKDMDANESAKVVETALKSGINFIDTAEMYRTYDPIRIAMEKTGIRPVIASKSNKKTYEGMENAVNEALDMLSIDYIDIFHLHAAREGENAFELFNDALQCLSDMKARGKVKAIGISTHSTVVTRKAAAIDKIDIVFPIINKIGRGIIDGTKEDMIDAIQNAAIAGKGIYFMKALAGGSLISEYDAAMTFVRNIGSYSSIAIGMVSPEEVEFNIRYFNGEKLVSIPDTVKEQKM